MDKEIVDAIAVLQDPLASAERRRRARMLLPRFHHVREHPDPVEVLGHDHSSGSLAVVLRAGDAIGRAAVAMDGVAPGIALELRRILALGACPRLTVENGRIMEVARPDVSLHEANVAILAAAGTTVHALRRWVAPQTLWADERMPRGRTRGPHRDLGWHMGRPVHRRRWGAEFSEATPDNPFVAELSEGVVLIARQTDTTASAMAGAALDDFVRLPGIAGLGFVIDHAEQFVTVQTDVPVTRLVLRGEQVPLV